MSLPRKIMEQCTLCTAKLWSNADFAPQNYGAIQTLPRKIMEQCRLCPAKSLSLRSSPLEIMDPSFFARDIMEQCRVCPANSFRGQNNNRNYLKIRLTFLFSFCFCKSMLFQRSTPTYQPVFKGKKYFVSPYL